MQIIGPDILVFDSGLGGLTVLQEIVKLRPDARYRYVADDALFPYGDLEAGALVSRVGEVLAPLVTARAPDIAVIACNTASTLVLPPLRAAFPEIAFVGTVPAVKPAAERSATRLISVLATPGTVARDYTRGLIQDFASHCEVELVGSRALARLAEDFMRGGRVDDDAIRREIEPCFVARDGRRTDHVVLACTHYPLLREHFARLAPWPVEWVDPAPAIARQVERLALGRGFVASAGALAAPDIDTLFTSGGRPSGAWRRILEGAGAPTP